MEKFASILKFCSDKVMVGISIGVSVDMVLYRQFANKPTCGQSGMKSCGLHDL